MFGDTWKIINVPTKGVLNNVNEFYKREGEVGYSTNGYKVIDDLVSRKVVMDKIMMFTDCQLWDSQADGNSLSISWSKYRTIAPNAKLYLFDLAGYGQMPIDVRKNDVYLIAVDTNSGFWEVYEKIIFEKENSLPTWLIVVIVVGSIILIIFVIILVKCTCLKKRRDESDSNRLLEEEA